MVAARRGGAQAATRDPKAIDDGLQSCITDTRVTRAISSDEAYERRDASTSVVERCATRRKLQLKWVNTEWKQVEDDRHEL